ncbi:type II and III secretion system protein family protein [Phenylobacterium aquaticum]|uniref:type II and III secretion system protein family protein n=1 Tax=Phenylobacterium aquaticum TaxID=1763816 RepID=UPI001F5CDA42|nr:pilus assembly protein N-terminal domain-containing protein [Phenylobacterium aquaticum]
MIGRAWILGIAAAGAASVASAAAAQGGPTLVPQGGVVMLTPASDVDSVVVSNDTALGVEVQDTRHIVVFGKQEGSGEIILLDARKRPIDRRQVSVVADVSGIQALIDQSTPGSHIKVAKSSSVIVLSGTAENSAQVKLAADIAASAFPTSSIKVLNLIRSAANDQLAVSVRVMEVRQTRLRELGIKWTAQNRYNQGTGQIGNLFNSALGTTGAQDLFATAKFTIDRLTLDAYINFLRSEGAATMLAEPTIVATSGQKAKFLAGGELPVPVPTVFSGSNQVVNSYTYKPYGISLEFTAQILDANSLTLQLQPEVSAIDDSHVVDLNGSKVPGLVTRKTETTVDLNFGESVAIAGLRAREENRDRRGLPFSTPFGIGDALAGANNSKRSDTELVIIVTPERVSDSQQAAMPAPDMTAAQPKPAKPAAAPKPTPRPTTKPQASASAPKTPTKPGPVLAAKGKGPVLAPHGLEPPSAPTRLAK